MRKWHVRHTNTSFWISTTPSLRAAVISKHEIAPVDDGMGFYFSDYQGRVSYVRKRRHLQTFISTLLTKGIKIIVWSAGNESLREADMRHLVRQ